jgi:cytochrome P450
MIRPRVLSESTDPDLFLAVTQIGVTPDPYPTYQRLRSDYPVGDIFGAVHLSRYVDVDAVLRHARVSSDDRNSAVHQRLLADGRLALPYLSQMDTRSFLHRDPPEHTRLRRLVTKAFAAHRVDALRPFIQGMVDEIVDDAAGEGLDIVTELASPLPIAVVSELLGVPNEDRAAVASWPRAQLCCSFEPTSLRAAAEAEHPASAQRHQVEADRIQGQLTDYFALLIESRRAQPGHDLVSELIVVEEQGEQLSEEELNATLRLLFVGGYETTINLIANGLLALLRHPDQWALLRDKPALAASAVEEALRYDAPFQFTRRIAIADIDVGGYEIGTGQTMFLWLASANRDPAAFERPDGFNIERTSHRHLSFGAGIHACLGGPLARLQAEIVFTTMTQRVVEPMLRTDPPSYRADAFRALEALPIAFADVRSAAGSAA